nr:hypothetical protein [uncultured Psychroserpens sp.]
MKNLKNLSIILFSLALFIYSCNDKSTTQKQDADTSTNVVESTKEVTPPATKEPAQNANGVWHYTCIIGCPEGAGSATKCKTCGNTLVHNTTYHANSANSANSAPFASANAANAATPPPEPAQNAAGVWHYTCAKGHTGGAGSAVACGTCGETLAHNKAYH